MKALAQAVCSSRGWELRQVRFYTGVPDDVSYENYLYYRRRLCELDH